MKFCVRITAVIFSLLFFVLSFQEAMAFSFNVEKPYQSSMVKFLGRLQGGPFSLVPFGHLPTTVVSGGTTTAIYTITNNTSRTLPNCQVQTIPTNTTRVTTGDGVCGASFTLASHESCKVELTVSGPVNNLPPLFVCDQYGTSCSGNKDYPLIVTSITAKSLSISPNNVSIPRGQSQQYTVMATYSDGTSSDVTAQASWSSSKPSVASVSGTGFAVAQGIGSATITASLYGLSTSTNLSVTSPTISSISVTPIQVFLPLSQTLQYTAVATYSDGSTGDVTSSVLWSSSNTTVATVSNVGPTKGLVSASVATPGESAISATLGGVTGTTPLTVTAATVTSITVTPSPVSVPLGLTQQFTAIAIYSDSTSHDVTSSADWSSSNVNVATIQTNGDTVPGLAKVGTDPSILSQSATITANYAGHSGAATLSPSAATLQSITLSPQAPHEPAGEVVHFTATGNYSDGSSLSITNLVTWSSDNTAAVTISNTGGTQGYATAVAVGSANISAVYNGVSASTPMTVTSAVLTSIAVSPANASEPKGSSLGYTATGTYSNGSQLDITSSVSWVSTNTNVAQINPSTGLATVVSSTGSTTIQATSGSISGSTQLNATPPNLLSITVTPSGIVLPNGESEQYTATGHFSDASTQDLTSSVTWTTSSNAIATITPGGLATARAASGIAFVIATSGSVVGSTTVTDTSAVVQSIAVTPANPTVGQGLTQQFTAIATYSDSTTANVTTQAVWTSSSPSVATISNASGTKGLATTIITGSTTIQAAYLGVLGNTTLTVGSPVPTSIAVTPATFSLANGTTQQMTAKVTFSNGSIINETSNSTWSSVNSAIATVNTTGLVTAVASSGSTSIQAQFTSGGVTVSNAATVTDTSAVVASVSVTPSTATVAQNSSVSFAAIAHYTDSTTQNVTQLASWTSDNTGVATVISGGPQSGTATAHAATGTANITATFGGQHGTAVLTASGPALVSIAVTPNPSTVLVANPGVQFTATGTYSDRTTLNLTNLATWNSSLNSVATVSSTGFATPVAEGVASISASYSGITGAATLNVSSGDAFAAGQVNINSSTQPLGYLGNSFGVQWIGNLLGESGAYNSGMLQAARYIPGQQQYFGVGSAQTGSMTVGLIYPVETNGGADTPITEQAPLAATTTGFDDLTQSASTLMTVGWYDDSNGDYYPVAYTSTDGGSTWSLSTINTSTFAQGNNIFLNGVICQTGSNNCVSVGQYNQALGGIRPVVYHSTDGGQNWSDSGVRINAPGDSATNAVSWNGTNYTAVGYTTISFVTKYPAAYTSSDGYNWAITFAPPSIPGALQDISCTSSYCVAVGYYVTSNNTQAPIVFYKANTDAPWSIVKPNYNSSSGNSVLYGVSCTGTSCIAVGDTQNESIPISYYSSDSGRSWSGPTVLPLNSGSSNGILYGIAYHQ